MAVQSIRTAIQVRDVASDHLFMAAGEMSFGEMDGVREVHYLAQEVRTRTEALHDAGDLLPAGVGAPVIVGGKGRAGGFGIFGDSDFCSGLGRRRLGVRDLGVLDLGVLDLVFSSSLFFVVMLNLPFRQADLRRKSSYTGKPVAITRAPNAASRGLFTPINTRRMTISNKNARGVKG